MIGILLVNRNNTNVIPTLVNLKALYQNITGVLLEIYWKLML